MRNQTHNDLLTIIPNKAFFFSLVVESCLLYTGCIDDIVLYTLVYDKNTSIYLYIVLRLIAKIYLKILLSSTLWMRCEVIFEC